MIITDGANLIDYFVVGSTAYSSTGTGTQYKQTSSMIALGDKGVIYSQPYESPDFNDTPHQALMFSNLEAIDARIDKAIR